MDRARAVFQQTPLVSILITTLSLSIPFLAALWSSSAPSSPPSILSFNIHTPSLSLTPKVLDSDPRTNRTVWEAVSTAELHAGLERLEVGAWIPPHSHPTEEIFTIVAGVAHVYDEDGQYHRSGPGSLVHVRKQARHAIRNAGDEPLLLMWIFPASGDAKKFQFQQRYGRPET